MQIDAFHVTSIVGNSSSRKGDRESSFLKNDRGDKDS